jgi:Protein of unknown function (DUF4235)
MTKVLFLPFRVLAGIFGGLLSRKAFALAWGAIDDHEPPKPQQRSARLGKLALALALEGAVFRLGKGLVDHASRSSFARLTGRWPGEKPSQDQQQDQ